MKRICLFSSFLIIVLVLTNFAVAQETRMVPMYRCLWIGPEGGTWNNLGGDPNAVWETYELSWTDPEGYLINWTLIENPVYTWPDIISMAELKDNAIVFVNEPPPTAIQGLVIRDANLTVNNDLTVVGDGQDDGFMAVCVGQGANGILNINGGTLTCGSTEGPLPGQTGPIVNNFGGSRFFVGRAINATDSAKGIVNQYGGTVRIANHLQIADIGYGEARELLGGYDCWGNLTDEEKKAISSTSANSTYNLYDGVLEIINNIEVGKANGSYGIFNVYGGEVNVGGMLRAYYNGEMTIDGGTVNVTGNLVWPLRDPSLGVLNMLSGSLSFSGAVICDSGIGISDVNVFGGSFDCRGHWEARGSGGAGLTQQTLKIDCGNVENVHFGSLDAALDTYDLMDLVLVVPNTEPNNTATKVWIDGDVTFNGWTAIHIDVNKDFAGQVGDTWELVNIGGNVTGMDQVLILNDSPKYIFSVELVEREVDSDFRKIITAELIDIIPEPAPVHLYTFEDGTAKDEIDSADGTLVGGAEIIDGAMVTTAQDQWMEMPGDVIAMNTYDAVTIEAWYIPTAGANTSWSMLAYFGDSVDGLGSNGFFITSARGDDKSRAAISIGDIATPWASESGADGPEIDDGLLHQMASTIDGTDITLYIDGELIASTPLSAANQISGISQNYAYLAKGGYTGDPEWIGAIEQFAIYDVALSEAQIAANYAAGPIKPVEVPIVNPSFESPDLGPGNTGQWADYVDGWVINGAGWAYLEDGTWFPTPDGINILKLWNGAYIWQQIGTVSPNTDYEISIWIGRGDESSALQVELWAGGDPSLLPDKYGEIDATVGAALINGAALTPSVEVGENELMSLTLNTGDGVSDGDALWVKIENIGNSATWIDDVAVILP
jgi:hypothetical protein